MINTLAPVTGSMSAANQAVSIAVNAKGGLIAANGVNAVVSGTWAGTLTFEATVDGTNWFACPVIPAPGGIGSSTQTANGSYQTGVAGIVGFRVRCTTYSSGTAQVSLRPLERLQDTVGVIDVANYLRGNPAAITDNTAHDVIAAQATGVRTYVTTLLVTCSHATQGTLVTITDGSGGTTLVQGYAAPAGGGFSMSCDPPLVTTAATALSAICGTTGSNVYISALGFKGP